MGRRGGDSRGDRGRSGGGWAGVAPFPSTIPWTGILDVSTRAEADGTACPTIANTGTAGGSWTPGGAPVIKTGIIGGKRVIRFNGTTDTLLGLGVPAYTSAAAYAIVLVGISNVANAASADATASNDPALWGDANGAIAMPSSVTAGKLWRAYQNAFCVNSATPAGGSPAVAVMQLSGGTLSLQIGVGGTPGTVGGVPNLSGASTFEIGTGFAKSACDIGCVLALNRALTAPELVATMAWVQGNWGNI